jgi:CHRD domain
MAIRIPSTPYTKGLLMRAISSLVTSIAIAALAACSGMDGGAGMSSSGSGSLALSGAQEVPPVTTSGAGTGSIAVAPDGAVSGSVTTTGMSGTMAHIHMAPAGKNGPVIIPLTKSGDSTWTVPPGAKLTPEQLQSYQAGDLYVNVHTDANKGGEVRAQLKP